MEFARFTDAWTIIDMCSNGQANNGLGPHFRSGGSVEGEQGVCIRILGGE